MSTTKTAADQTTCQQMTTGYLTLSPAGTMHQQGTGHFATLDQRAAAMMACMMMAQAMVQAPKLAFDTAMAEGRVHDSNRKANSQAFGFVSGPSITRKPGKREIERQRTIAAWNRPI
jgi:hypothetical protein